MLLRLKRSAACPAIRNKKNIGQKLRQSDVAKIEWPSRNFVNLPTDGNREHLQSGDHEHALDLVKREIEMAEGGQPRVRVAFGFGHVLLM